MDGDIGLAGSRAFGNLRRSKPPNRFLMGLPFARLPACPLARFPIPDSRIPAMTKSTPVTLAILLLAACTGGERIDRSALEPALNAITSEGMLGHIRTLASDAYEGRAPGTAGEDSAVAYLTAQFKSLGLAPGNPDGSYVENVELVGYTGT